MASPSPSPTTGPQPLALTIGESGRSGVEAIVHMLLARWPSSRSVSACRRGKATSGSRAHVLASAAGEVVLLGEQVVGPVAHPPRLDEHDLGGRRQHVGEQLSSSMSHGSQLSMPSKRAPSASRSHCSRPHGSLADQLGGPGADLVVGQQLAGREDQRLGEVGGAALVVDAERR